MTDHTDLGAPLTELDRDDLRKMAEEIAYLRLQVSNITGAAAAAVHAIHKAGGYVVFDPCHQEPVKQAINGLAHAVADRLESTRSRVPYGLPRLDHTLINLEA